MESEAAGLGKLRSSANLWISQSQTVWEEGSNKKLRMRVAIIEKIKSKFILNITIFFSKNYK